MKKIFLVLFLVSTLFFYFNAFSATKCSTFNSESSISDSINDCLSDSKVLVQAN
ncbi:secreted protein [sediment metagenome]|uniref:Secreted protein n=1 Tax=sediment metagenome TaxID=749907 RepID=D9PKD1_9ZZZZ